MESADRERGQRLAYAMAKRRVRKLLSLAVEVGVDESALCRWRKGGTITIGNAVKLCRILDMSLDWFLTGDGHMDMHKGLSVSEEEYALMKHIRAGGGDIVKAIRVLIDYHY